MRARIIGGRSMLGIRSCSGQRHRRSGRRRRGRTLSVQSSKNWPSVSRRRVPMSMQGKVVVITGSNIGIGKETAVGVAKEGATVVLACRNQEKAAAAAKDIQQRSGNDDVQLV